MKKRRRLVEDDGKFIFSAASLNRSLKYADKTFLHTKEKITRLVKRSLDQQLPVRSFSGLIFNEQTKYDPRSPYSASKAASDFTVRPEKQDVLGALENVAAYPAAAGLLTGLQTEQE